MSRALFGAFAVQHQDASVHGRGLTNKGCGCISVEGGDAAAKGAFAFGGQRHGLFNVSVGHQGADGAKCLHVVHGCAVVRIVLAHQHGREEGPTFGVGAKRLGRSVLSKNPLRLLFNSRDLIEDVLTLFDFPTRLPSERRPPEGRRWWFWRVVGQGPLELDR